MIRGGGRGFRDQELNRNGWRGNSVLKVDRLRNSLLRGGWIY
jgi:hypothetical protein